MPGCGVASAKCNRDIMMAEKQGFGESFTVTGGDYFNAGLVSSRIKKLLKECGIPEQAVRKAAVVTFEAEVNIVSYAVTGIISVKVENGSIFIEARDQGEGIPDIESALLEGFTTANDKVREMGFGAGMGLPNIKKCTDAMEIRTEIGVGTTLEMVFNNG